MTQKTVDFYFDIVCPYAFLASTQLKALAKRNQAIVYYKPILLGGIFKHLKAPQVPMTQMSEGKKKHNFLDMHRFADLFKTSLSMPKEHPRKTLYAMRAICAASDPQQAANALFCAYWQQNLNIENRDILKDILQKAHLDGRDIVHQIDTPKIKEKLRTNCDKALKTGVFGVPTFIVNQQLFFGQDRLHFVEKALNGWKPKIPKFP